MRSTRTEGSRGSVVSSATPWPVATRTGAAAGDRRPCRLARGMSAVCHRGRREIRGDRAAPACDAVRTMTVSEHLAPDRHSPAKARAALEPLRGVVGAQLLEDLRLVVSELVANAVVHGPRTGPIELRVAVDEGGRVRGEVADRRHGTVDIRSSADQSGGWGLRLVDELSDSWGVYPGSTHVW